MSHKRTLGSAGAEMRTYASVMLISSLIVLGNSMVHDIRATVMGGVLGAMIGGIFEWRSVRSLRTNSIDEARQLPPDGHIETLTRTVVRTVVRAVLMYVPVVVAVLVASSQLGVLPYAGAGAIAGVWLAGSLSYGSASVVVQKFEGARHQSLLRETGQWAWHETRQHSSRGSRGRRSWTFFVAPAASSQFQFPRHE